MLRSFHGQWRDISPYSSPFAAFNLSADPGPDIAGVPVQWFHRPYLRLFVDISDIVFKCYCPADSPGDYLRHFTVHPGGCAAASTALEFSRSTVMQVNVGIDST